MKRIFAVLIFLGCMIFPAMVSSQTSGNTPPPPPVCGSTNAGALYTNTGTSPATVYTCSYYNLVWQWVVNPSYGGLVYYPNLPTTCSGALPVFLAGWPNTKEYVCVYGVPNPIGGGGSGGVTSLNTLTGALTLAAGANTTITPSGNTLTIASTGGGSTAGMVQYNPATTAYYIVGVSSMLDDGDGHSTALPIISYTCSSGTCTVNFTSAHGLSVGGAIDMHTATGWPNSGTQGPMSGSFQVASVPTTTQATFAYSTTASCSSSCGTVYDASYWADWQFAREPYIYGHGTVYGGFTSMQTLSTSFSSEVNCSAGTPTYLIIEGGQNDLLAATPVATIEGYYQSIWQQAHAAGCIVVQGTVVPVGYGIYFSQSLFTGALQLNNWMYGQAKSPTNASTGQYWDRVFDPASSLVDRTATGMMPNASANKIFASRLNEAFSEQDSSVAGLPPLTGSDQISVFDPGGLAHYMPSSYEQFFTSNADLWMQWSNIGIDLIETNPISMLRVSDTSLAGGSSFCPLGYGVDFSNNNNAFYDCFGYAGTGSTSNYRGIWATGGSNMVAKFFATGVVQFPSIVASSGLAALCVDTSGNVQVGACGGGSMTWPSGAAGVPNYNGSSGYGTTYNSSNPFPLNFMGSGTAAVGKYIDGGTGAWTTLPTGGGSAFSAITPGTSGAALLMGSGGSLGHTGTGTIDATSENGVTCTGTPTSGQVCTATGTSTATWQTTGAGVALKFCSGTITLSGTLASGTTAPVGTATCTGLTSDDRVIVTFNGNIFTLGGFIPSTNGVLSLAVQPSTDLITINAENNTSISQTIPTGSGIVINYLVIR